MKSFVFRVVNLSNFFLNVLIAVLIYLFAICLFDKFFYYGVIQFIRSQLVYLSQKAKEEGIAA